MTYANSAFVRPYTETYGLDLAQELKEKGYLQVEAGKKDLLAVIISGHKDALGGTDTIQLIHI